MTTDGSYDPFGDFDKSWREGQTAEQFSYGRIPPGTYRVVASAQNTKNDGVLHDYDVVDKRAQGKSLGFKLFFEILEPDTVKNPKTGEPVKTKGEVQEHVFWITEKNLPYVKRDLFTILGRDLESIKELTKIQWAGRTCELVIREEEFEGRLNAKVAFINAWKPGGKATAPSIPIPAGAKAKTGKAESKSSVTF